MPTPNPFSMLAIGIAIGLSVSTVISHPITARLEAPIIASVKLAKIDPLLFKFHKEMPETTVILEFLSNNSWKLLDQPKDVAGLTINSQPCKVLLPAKDFAIDAIPRRGYAAWAANPIFNSSTLAHEILHCLAGRWHPTWSEIAKLREDDQAKPAFDLNIVNLDTETNSIPILLASMSDKSFEISDKEGTIIRFRNHSIEIPKGVKIDNTAHRFVNFVNEIVKQQR